MGQWLSVPMIVAGIALFVYFHRLPQTAAAAPGKPPAARR
jgi:prolipoprotein diacylglyceryltransferase